MDKQLIIDTYVKLLGNTVGYHEQKDLFVEANKLRCYVYYERPEWVTDEIFEMMKYIAAMYKDVKEVKVLENEAEEAWFKKVHEISKRNRASYEKRQAKKEAEGEAWKEKVKVGDVVEIKNGRQSPQYRQIFDMDDKNAYGWVLRFTKDLNTGEKYFRKTTYTAKNLYKFITRIITNYEIRK